MKWPCETIKVRICQYIGIWSKYSLFPFFISCYFIFPKWMPCWHLRENNGKRNFSFWSWKNFSSCRNLEFWRSTDKLIGMPSMERHPKKYLVSSQTDDVVLLQQWWHFLWVKKTSWYWSCMMIFHACDQIERIILDQEWLFFFQTQFYCSIHNRNHAIHRKKK